MKKNINVAVIGCTGIVGQVFVQLLSGHPYFNISFLGASPRRANKPYDREVTWSLPLPMPANLAERPIESLDTGVLEERDIKIVFSALPAAVAKTVEPGLRDRGFYVFSNASALRYDKDVPVLIPEVNPEALAEIERQGFPGKGFVITNANCSTTGLAVALAPLKRFAIREVFVSTYQSVSGAGYPGIPSLDISGNALPHIEKEEEKMIIELQKILDIEAAIFPTCVRIPTLWGHLETVWVTFDREVAPGEIIEAWESLGHGLPPLPSGSGSPVVYREDKDFPQPRWSFFGDPPGMPVWTGQLKTKGNKAGFTLLVNNIVKGAAGGSIQNAEAFVHTYGEHI